MKMISNRCRLLAIGMSICSTMLAIPSQAEPKRIDSQNGPRLSTIHPLSSQSALQGEEFFAGVAEKIEARIPGKGLNWFSFRRVAAGRKNNTLVVLYTSQHENRVHRIANYYHVADGKAVFFRTTGVDLTRQQIAEPLNKVDSSVDVLETDSDIHGRTLVPSSNECPSEC